MSGNQIHDIHIGANYLRGCFLDNTEIVVLDRDCVCVCVCVCVRVRARVRARMFMWFMRTQMCIMTWV